MKNYEIENNENKENILTEEDILLQKLIGIKDFDTSKNKSHVDTDLSGVFKGKQLKKRYRAFMNSSGAYKKKNNVII